VGMQRAVAGRPLVPGIKTRVARQRIAQLGQIAATQLEEAAICQGQLTFGSYTFLVRPWKN